MGQPVLRGEIERVLQLQTCICIVRTIGWERFFNKIKHFRRVATATIRSRRISSRSRRCHPSVYGYAVYKFTP